MSAIYRGNITSSHQSNQKKHSKAKQTNTTCRKKLKAKETACVWVGVYIQRHTSHVVVIDMLAEGRIAQPPSTRSVDSSGGGGGGGVAAAVTSSAASVSSSTKKKIKTAARKEKTSSTLPNCRLLSLPLYASSGNVPIVTKSERLPPRQHRTVICKTKATDTRQRSITHRSGSFREAKKNISFTSKRNNSDCARTISSSTRIDLICTILTSAASLLVAAVLLSPVKYLCWSPRSSSSNSRSCRHRINSRSIIAHLLIFILSVAVMTLAIAVPGPALVGASWSPTSSSSPQDSLSSSSHTSSSSSPLSLSSSSSLSSQHSSDQSASTDSRLNQRHGFEAAEKHFLQIMGLHEKPRLEAHHKVPEYMLDLYHWFRADDDDNQVFDDDDNHQKVEFSSTPKAVIEITSEDLRKMHDRRHLNDLIEHQHDSGKFGDNGKSERQMSNPQNHHRAASKRRSSQAPRVMLSGPAHTIISHRLDNHDVPNANRRIRRSVNWTSGKHVEGDSSEEAHLTFNMKLPDGELLQGAELRLYRNPISAEASSSHEISPDHHRFSSTMHLRRFEFSPYHWSIRYRSVSMNETILTTSQQRLYEHSSSNSQHLEERKYSQSNVDDRTRHLQRINVYYLLRPIDELHEVTIGASSEEPMRRVAPLVKLIDTQVIDVRHSGWLSFDIKPAIEHWLTNPAQNFGLLVTFTDQSGQRGSPHSNVVVVNREDSHVQSTSQPEQQQYQDSPWHEVQPVVITFSSKSQLKSSTKQGDDKSGGRVKRADGHHRHAASSARKANKAFGPTSHRSKEQPRHHGHRRNYKKSAKTRDRCSRQPLFFDFDKVDWKDWVVAPNGFQAYFCAGDCSFPMGNLLNYTNHATIQALMSSIDKNVVPTPCCVPTDLKPITLLYFDKDKKVVLTNFHDMVVEGCGCR